jgi:hypothetical protein
MRTALSPLIQQVEAHVRVQAPGAVITHNLAGDSFIVALSGHPAAHTFSISPRFSSSYDTVATWPIYVTPIPSPEPKSWECRTLDQIAETLRWPSLIPKVPTKSAAELQAEAGIG